jgi:hypothetical protein
MSLMVVVFLRSVLVLMVDWLWLDTEISHPTTILQFSVVSPNPPALLSLIGSNRVLFPRANETVAQF